MTDPSSHDEPFRHYLRERRLARGLSLGELAQLAETDEAAIAGYESGDNIPIEMQSRLMEVLDIRPPQFFKPPPS